MTLGNPPFLLQVCPKLIMRVLVVTAVDQSVPKFDFATGVKGPGGPRRQRRQGTPSLKKKVYL